MKHAQQLSMGLVFLLVREGNPTSGYLLSLGQGVLPPTWACAGAFFGPGKLGCWPTHGINKDNNNSNNMNKIEIQK